MNRRIISLLMLSSLAFACSKGDDYSGEKQESEPVPAVQPAEEIDKSTDKFINVRADIPLKAFHADVFSDGGIHASSMKEMPAADYLGLSFECLCSASSDYVKEDSLAQDNTFIGCPEDLNGKLLYPDGAPRYKVVFVNGGNATSHGRSLKKEGRENFKLFVANGGSYIGSCAGAFVAAEGSDSKLNENYIGLWPSRATNCHLSDARTGHFVDEDSPLLKYYDFGGDRYIASVYHNGGCCVEDKYMIAGTEILARFDYDIAPSEHNYMHGKGSVWAYKPNATSGRVIMSGSHPENVKDGEIRDMMAGMLRYAIEGQGITTIKSILHNGETITMDKFAGDPAHTRIGDMQCHHFAIWVPDNAGNIKVTLQPMESKYDFRLMLAKETFAYAEDAQYVYESKGGKAAVAEFSNLAPGQWYICVQCTSDVKAYSSVRGTSYISSDLLNGTPYKISLSME